MWYTALIMGLAGSLHCAGMCSPLLMAVTNLTSSVALNRIVYNAGRILTYGILGGLLSGAVSSLPITRYQSLLSLLFGIALVVLALTRFHTFKIPGLSTAINHVTSFIKEKFAFFLSRKHSPAVFMMGMLNGVLPCGMTSIALGYCLILEGPLDGFKFMLLFGVGTLPVMIGLAPVILVAIRRLNLSFQKITTVLMIFSGLLLIARVFIYASTESQINNVGIMDIVLCR